MKKWNADYAHRADKRRFINPRKSALLAYHKASTSLRNLRSKMKEFKSQGIILTAVIDEKLSLEQRVDNFCN